MARQARLPMFLGLAALTAAAHLLATLAHLAGGHADWRDWPLGLLLAAAPIAGVALALRGRPRHGALTLAVAMAAAAWWTLSSHYLMPGDAASPPLYAWLIQMQLAFELQGFAVGLVLVVRPQVPRARADAAG